jgi:hypothetical protein
MADDIVSLSRLEAGRDYLAALDGLGFLTETMMWTIAGTGNNVDPELSIVTSFIERVGSNEIYELLFEAYEKAGTPSEIDPWIVSLYGSGTQFAHAAKGMHIVGGANLNFADGSQREFPDELWHGVVDRLTKPSWIYKLGNVVDDWTLQKRRFAKFQKNVHALSKPENRPQSW